MSWRAWLSRLDSPRDIKRPLYRAHRVAGLLLFSGALFTLDQLVFQSTPALFAQLFAESGHPVTRIVLAEAMHLFLILGNALALVFGAVVIVRPSLLKGIERWADRVYGE
jgi:hypothetical protein